MRKGSGASGAGLYNNVLHHPHLQQQFQQHLHHQPQLHLSSGGGGPQLPPHLQQQFHSHQQQQQQQLLQQQQQQTGNMVQQQRVNPGGGGNGGRIFVNNHQSHQHQGGGNPYLHQGGIMLQHQHHGGGHQGPSIPGGPGQLHHQILHHSSRPIIPHGGAGFGNHPSGMGQGLNLAAQAAAAANSSGQGGHFVQSTTINSHFGTTTSSGTGSQGSNPVNLGQGHSSSPGGDLPPVETVVAKMETACRLLHGIGGNNTRIPEIASEIQVLSEDLRRVGAMLENSYPEVLDRVMSSMRDASAQPCLPPSLRLAIFELVELRASKWILPSDSSNYYRQRRNLNDAAAPGDSLDNRSSQNSASGGSGGQITVVVTPSGSSNPVKPEVIFPSGGVSGSSPTNNQGGVGVDLDTPPQPQPAKTYREEIIIKNSDSGKVAPTAKERVLSINGYSQQSINLAKQLIQETITRNASPVLDGMVLPGSSSPSGTSPGDFPDLSNLRGVDDAELELIRLKLQSVSGGQGSSSTSSGGGVSSAKLIDHATPHHSPHHSSSSTHFSYTVTLGEHSIRILGDDLQYVQEAKMALDDYFLQKYPDLFCADLNGIEDVDEDEDDEDDDTEEYQDPGSPTRYDRETLLSLSKVRTPPPNFSHLEPDIRGNIVLEKPRQFDLEKFSRETYNSAGSSSSSPGTPTTPTNPTFASTATVVLNSPGAAANTTPNNNNKVTADILPG